MLNDPITRWQNWCTVHELIKQVYNDFIYEMRDAEGDKDFLNYLIIERGLSNLLDFMATHENKLSCELDAYYEEQLQKCRQAM